GLAGRDDHADAHEHLDGLRRTAGGHGRGTYLVDLGAHRLLVLPADEHALGVVAGELQAACRGAGLEQQWRALRRRLTEVVALYLVELAVVAHRMYLV